MHEPQSNYGINRTMAGQKDYRPVAIGWASFIPAPQQALEVGQVAYLAAQCDS